MGLPATGTRVNPLQGHGSPHCGDTGQTSAGTQVSLLLGHRSPHHGEMGQASVGTWVSPPAGTQVNPLQGHGSPCRGPSPASGRSAAQPSLREEPEIAQPQHQRLAWIFGCAFSQKGDL